MAKKDQRISINKLESILKENVVEVPMVGNEEVTIRIKKTLSLDEMLQFVEDVVSSCVDPDDTRFIPEVKDFAVRKGVMSVYANFNMPDSVEKQYDLLYRTDVFFQVFRYVNQEQFRSILDSIDSRIDYELGLRKAAAANSVAVLVSRVEALIEQMESAFGNVEGGELNDFIKNISGMGSLSEEGLARAVLNLRKTDV